MTLSRAAAIYLENQDVFVEPCILSFHAVSESEDASEPIKKAAGFLINFLGSFGATQPGRAIHGFLQKVASNRPGDLSSAGSLRAVRLAGNGWQGFAK